MVELVPSLHSVIASFVAMDVMRKANYRHAADQDIKNFSTQMLDKIGVAATLGMDFEMQEGRHFLRLSSAENFDAISEAVKRLLTWKNQGYKRHF